MITVTVCQLPNEESAFDAAWESLARHVGEERSDILLLPEMPFGPWLAASKDPVVENWLASVDRHQQWIGRICEMGDIAAVGSRPVMDGTSRLNRGFTFCNGELTEVHEKFYLPCEEFFWEANWYQPGNGEFEVFQVAGARCGMMICTDMWFMQHARAFGKAGAEIIFVPRATPGDSPDEWLTGARTLAMISGCFVFSSNHCAPHYPDADLGGMGFAIDPGGVVLSTTSGEKPFFTGSVDLAVARAAKSTYPRYVEGD
jgi:N-carbamoylputrescine amidase